MKFFTSICLFITLMYSSQSNSQNASPFLEHIVMQFPNVRDLAMSPQHKEVIFSAQSIMGDISVLVGVNRQNDSWSSPEVLPFSGNYFDIEPFFSEDGLALYFASNRPLDATSTSPKDFDIWYVSRTKLDQPWSEPKNLGAPINTELDEFYPVITTSKNLYFTLDNTTLEQKDDIYVSEFINGNYTTPKRLSDAINSEGYEFNAYISPDESFMIYTCYNREDGLGSGDLYISYQNNNQWSTAKNMGSKINSDKMEYCPYVDISSQTLYFTSKRNSVKQPTDNKLKLDELKMLFDSYENGASRLYKTSISNYLSED